MDESSAQGSLATYADALHARLLPTAHQQCTHMSIWHSCTCTSPYCQTTLRNCGWGISDTCAADRWHWAMWAAMWGLA